MILICQLGWAEAQFFGTSGFPTNKKNIVIPAARIFQIQKNFSGDLPDYSSCTRAGQILFFLRGISGAEEFEPRATPALLGKNAGKSLPR